MSTYTLGIDPGKSGGMALLGGALPCVYKMPETEADLFRLLGRISREGRGLDEAHDPCKVFAYLEQVHSMPGQGVKSVFTLGVGYGGLRMALIACGIPFETVTPGKWQRALGCLSKGDKNVTKRRAQELFPPVKVTHAVADALLIAEHGRRIRDEEA